LLSLSTHFLLTEDNRKIKVATSTYLYFSFLFRPHLSCLHIQTKATQSEHIFDPFNFLSIFNMEQPIDDFDPLQELSPEDAYANLAISIRDNKQRLDGLVRQLTPLKAQMKALEAQIEPVIHQLTPLQAQAKALEVEIKTGEARLQKGKDNLLKFITPARPFAAQTTDALNGTHHPEATTLKVEPDQERKTSASLANELEKSERPEVQQTARDKEESHEDGQHITSRELTPKNDDDRLRRSKRRRSPTSPAYGKLILHLEIYPLLI
jgi:hypothetical protein